MPLRPKTFKWLRQLLAGLSLLNSVGSRVLANLQSPSAESTESVVVCVCVCVQDEIPKLFAHRFCAVAKVNNAGSGHDDLVRLELRG